jgi:hypothetical protein
MRVKIKASDGNGGFQVCRVVAGDTDCTFDQLKTAVAKACFAEDESYVGCIELSLNKRVRSKKGKHGAA